MQELINKFKEQKKEYTVLIDELDAKRTKIEERIERAYKQIEAIDKKVDKLVKPSKYDLFEDVAKKLADHFGLHYVIYGPFGMECETSAYFIKDPKKSITEQETFSLTVRLWRSSDEDWFVYDTGKRTDEYKRGSIGYLNGLNSVYAPLPYSFEEIIKIIEQNKEGVE